eukprot:CAMPEP_0168624386 /NCGR_PEP_ID=MMETSP0449_2-20121227/9372_1 /TAXON_ID=1082188 /ORGANISM="Strombidium rassoulzadegani, Strain ras09" /LENGTH=49 /DNA_ID= /DNA_START= /DNA_END= /DNA_ORIENTATION=
MRVGSIEAQRGLPQIGPLCKLEVVLELNDSRVPGQVLSQLGVVGQLAEP